MGDSGCGNVSNSGLVSDGGAVDNVGLLSVDGGGDGLVDGGGVSLSDLLVGVGAGLVHKGLVDGLVGPDGSVDLLGAEGGDVLEDGLGNVASQPVVLDGSGVMGGGPDQGGGSVA